MGAYETILFVLLGVSLFLFGVWLGRRLERYEVYLKLLASRDPQAWTIAHKLHRGPRPPTDDEGSDTYSPSHSPLERRAKSMQEQTTRRVRAPPTTPFPRTKRTAEPDSWKRPQ